MFFNNFQENYFAEAITQGIMFYSWKHFSLHNIAISIYKIQDQVLAASVIQTNVIAPHSKYSWMEFSIKSILAIKVKWLYVWKTKHQVTCVQESTAKYFIIFS